MRHITGTADQMSWEAALVVDEMLHKRVYSQMAKAYWESLGTKESETK